MNDSIKKIAKTVKKYTKIALVTHIGPDFDALGSSLSLYYGLKQMGKNVSIFVNDELSENQKLLVDINVIEKECDYKLFDLFISTDTPSRKRLGVYSESFANAKASIVLDHHKNDDLKGNYNFVDTNSSSCSEISFKLLKALRVNITKEIASLLYMGLSADTNSFVNSNTNKDSLLAAYKLIKLGADISHINEIQYRTQTSKDIELKKYLYDSYKMENNVAYCLVSFSNLQKLNARKADCDFYSSELISLQGANIAFSVIESSKNFYEISFRAKFGYDVRAIAEQLGGGGHIGAAGAKTQGKSINSIKDLIMNIIKKIESKK